MGCWKMKFLMCSHREVVLDECGQDFNFGLKIGDAGNAGSVSPPVDLAF